MMTCNGQPGISALLLMHINNSAQGLGRRLLPGFPGLPVNY